jgi:hypothetical protein
MNRAEASSLRLRVRTLLLPSRRVALGVREHAAPSLVFVAAGIVLGPESLGLLTGEVLAQLDPVISVTLALLGVFIGTGYATATDPRKLTWLAGATAQALVTLAAVATAMFVVLDRWRPPMPLDAVTMAGVLALCTAASAAVGLDHAEPSRAHTVTQLADFDDVPLMIVGALIVPVIAGITNPLAAVLISLAGGLIVGGAGVLLFTRARTIPERGVFVTGTVVLLGGTAAYASASPLATGCVAGLVWAVAHGTGSSSSLVESDLRRLQHPLVALLLVIAGASIQFTYALAWLCAPLVLFRLAGKLLASLAVARAMQVGPALVGAILAPPGILGIALALNVQQVLNTGDTILVASVTVATVIAELLAVVLLPGDDLA